MSTRRGGQGGWDLYLASRKNTGDLFGQVKNLGSGVNSPRDDYGPRLSSDGLFLFFSDFYTAPRSGGEGIADMWVAMRDSPEEPFSEGVNLNDFSLGSAINGAYSEFNLSISRDWPASGSELFFQAFNRPGGPGSGDIWQATWVSANGGGGEADVELHLDGDDVVVHFSGTLETATHLDGPWETVDTGGATLYKIGPEQQQARQFFRTRKH